VIGRITTQLAPPGVTALGQHRSMGFLAFPVLFLFVWALFDALLGSPWGLILAILFGFVLPGLLLAGGIAHDRERRRELAELSRPRPAATPPGSRRADGRRPPGTSTEPSGPEGGGSTS